MTDAAETAADAVECPRCGVAYPRARIEAHAATCDGTASPQPRAEKRPKTADGDAEDADYQLALRLQAELDAEASQAYTCGLCHHTVPVANLSSVDVCFLECFSSFLELPFFTTRSQLVQKKSFIHSNTTQTKRNTERRKMGEKTKLKTPNTKKTPKQ